MRQILALVSAVLLASASHAVGQTAMPVTSVPAVAPHAQPSERQLKQLPASERQRLTVDLSSHDAGAVEQLYQQLTHSRRRRPAD